MKCPRCQAQNDTGTRFCEDCGTRLEMACPSCGAPVTSGKKFCRSCGAALTAEPSRFISPDSYTPRHLAEKILTSKGALEGERKQVTVLFADLKGSMELLADRDPEEARRILDPVLERMMEAVHRYEGTVNQVMGDGIMALFGAPLAHEDHAIRGCYAALRMQEAVRRYSEDLRRAHGVEVQIRVGLNSGGVVVRSVGSDLRMDYTAVGQTTHLAGRMEQLAVPGSIRITADTLALAEGYVAVKPLGPVPVKGLVEPIEVYELIGTGVARTRLQAAARRGLSRFVGRDAEMEQLRGALAKAARGHGQVVSVIGEPGVGKSRLFYEFLHSHRTHGWLVLESCSVSYGKATTYLPVIELLKGYFRIQYRDEHREIREKVTGKLLTLDESLRPVLPAVLALLDVPVDDRDWQTLDPPQRRRHTLEAIKRLLVRESQVQPLCLVFEDLHWIDAETQALLDGLVESLPAARILLLVNYRPEYRHGWGGKTYYSQARIDPLPEESAVELLDALLGADRSLGALKSLLIDRTEGNPFFLEESVRTLIETKVLTGERGGYRLARSVDTVQVPATVQAVLAARIDRLPPSEKRLLQSAAVIGHEVPFLLLESITEESEDQLRRELAHLQAAEFLYETRMFPDLEYTFRHALTHEVAYGGLLQDRRHALHARIVEAIERLYPDRIVEHLERLAHHALRGEAWDKALAYYRQAGDKAAARSAYRDAVGYFDQALSTLPHLPERRELREQAIDLRLALRNALLPSGDSERVLVSLREAEYIAVALNDARRLGQICGFLSVHFRNMGTYDEAITAAERSLTLATAGGDTVVQARANLYLGAAHWAEGEYLRAIDCLMQTIASLHGTQRRERLGQTNLPSVQALALLAACHAELGLFADGTASGEEGLQIAEAAAHPGSIMWASYGLGLLSLCKGDLPKALPLLERAMDICRDADLPLFLPRMAAVLGRAYALSGRVADAVALLRPAVEQTMATEMAGFRALCGLPLGEAQMLAGRLEDAHAVVESALTLARAHHERGNEAYGLCLLGEIVARRDCAELAPSASHYQQALALAGELRMRPLVAHCHLGLGKLYRRVRKREQAQEHLTTATTMYRAMEMRFWLEKAEAETRDLG